MLSAQAFHKLTASEKRETLSQIYQQLNEQHIFDDMLFILCSKAPLSDERLSQMYGWLLQLKSNNEEILADTSKKIMLQNKKKHDKQHQNDQQEAENLLAAYS